MVQEGIGSKELFTTNVNLLSENKKEARSNTFFVLDLAFRCTREKSAVTSLLVYFSVIVTVLILMVCSGTLVSPVCGLAFTFVPAIFCTTSIPPTTFPKIV